jgi:hypothetical protein
MQLILYTCWLPTNIVKISILQKVIYGFNAVSIKIPMKLENSKIHFETQKTPNSKANMYKKNAVCITIFDLKLYNMPIITKHHVTGTKTDT